MVSVGLPAVFPLYVDRVGGKWYNKCMNYEKLSSIVKAAQKRSGVDKVIARLENEVGIKFPEDYKEHLRSGKPITLSGGEGAWFVHPIGKNTRGVDILKLYNNREGDDAYPIFTIGEDAGGNPFGYLKGSDDKQIYDCFHEDNTLTPLAKSLTDMIRRGKAGKLSLHNELQPSEDAVRINSSSPWGKIKTASDKGEDKEQKKLGWLTR